MAATPSRLSDPVAAADAPRPVTRAMRSAFVCRDGLLYRCSSRGDRLCVPAGFARRSLASSTRHSWAGTLVATKPSLWLVVRCGGPA